MGTRVEIETEITVKVRASAVIQPAEPDVGISQPYIEDLAIEEISGLGIELMMSKPRQVSGGWERVLKGYFNWSDDNAAIEAIENQLTDLLLEEAAEQAAGDADAKREARRYD